MSEPVSKKMREEIIARINVLEAEEEVKVLFAVESGSRAWGFHSPDSDYDVRFVYARPPEWHYRLGKKRDVIEYPIDDELDISGWELSKALSLALGSNAVVAEWLQSPIVYKADDHAVDALTKFAKRALQRKSVTWHYVSLTKRQAKRSRDSDGKLRIKRWFYMLRPALALRWIRLNDQAMPPMDLQTLRDGCELSKDVSDAIDDLLAQKRIAKEKAVIEQGSPLLDDLISGEIQLANAWLSSVESEAYEGLSNEASALHMDLSARAFQ